MAAPSSNFTATDNDASVKPGRELGASVVVFLVALPLCMGVAIASGVPPALGIVTGIVGGLLIGAVSGSPLQVSGPAAGLVVLVFAFVQQWGLARLGVLVFAGGAIQLAAGALGLGRWFRAVSPAVVQGMLAGIGVLIFASQVHVLVDDSPRASGLENLASIPAAFYKGVLVFDGSQHHVAAMVGLSTLVSLLLWQRWRPKKLHAIPAPLVGVVVGTVAAQWGGLSINTVDVPDSLLSSLNVPAWSDFELLLDSAFLGPVIALALIASAETLLCAGAVDAMHNGPRTNYDKELRAQGLGNMTCGLLGALPATGVIVRSSANVEAGARTRASAMVHGVWLLLLISALPGVLQLIPTACLAAILVHVGVKLMNPGAAKKLLEEGKDEFAIYLTTIVFVVAVDLLTGVVIGFALSLFKLVYTFTHLEITEEEAESPKRVDIYLRGAATFVRLPDLAHTLEKYTGTHEVHVHFGGLAYVDHACMELLRSWEKTHEASGGEVVIEWDALGMRREAKPVINRTRFSIPPIRKKSSKAPPPAL